MNRFIRLFTFVVVFSASASFAQEPKEDSAEVTAAVEKFHAALRKGDANAAMELLAPDAIILESGSAETRAEYEEHHLAEDIVFSRAVPSTRSTIAVHIEGNGAWITSTSIVRGNFNGREVNSAGTELMVLTKSPAGWRIRAIHWSNRKTNQ